MPVEPQPLVEPLGHQVDGLQQFAQSVQGEKVWLQRKKHFVDGGQGIERQDAERRRAIDE